MSTVIQECLQRTMHIEYLEHLSSVLSTHLAGSSTPSWQVRSLWKAILCVKPATLCGTGRLHKQNFVIPAMFPSIFFHLFLSQWKPFCSCCKEWPPMRTSRVLPCFRTSSLSSHACLLTLLSSRPPSLF